ncbi:MAG: heavy metal translocating P-type ATPase [Rhodanobacteraceae bacterium]|nr:heavy metal translocating P-type ATPase [Rhodanobacteraceae bacterium]
MAALVAGLPSGCFHCAEVLPAQAPTVAVDGVTRAFCCDGCAAAALWIRDAGLSQYYRLRRDEARRVSAEEEDFSAWMQPEILAEHAWAVPGGMEIVVLSAGLRCAACAWLVDQALMRENGVLDVTANAATGRIRLRWNPSAVDLSKLLQRLGALGFAPVLATGTARERTRRREWRRDVLRLGLAGIGAMQAMMFAEALYLDTAAQMPVATRDFLRWTTLLVSTPVVFIAGWPFIAGLLRGLRERSATMDVLAGASILLAYFASVVETLRGGGQVWFDASVMFVFLLLTARQLEQWARRRATLCVDALAQRRPVFAQREEGDGTLTRIATAKIRVGDVLRVDAGDSVPADGVLLDAQAALDEALLTGEALPVLRRRGDPIAAGSNCCERPLRLRVVRVGGDTRLAQLVRLLEQAQTQRPRLARAADRAARQFANGVLIAAVLVFGAWWWWQPARAFEVVLALLVISCPCALALALPAALAAATDALARRGVLVVRADAVEVLAAVDTLILDKTGTLTDTRLARDTVQTFGGMTCDEVLAIAASLQGDATHPLAAAFRAAAASGPELPRVASGTGQGTGPIAEPGAAEQAQIPCGLRPGLGIEGCVGGRHYRLGRADFAAARDDDGAVWLGDGQTALARFSVEQQLRANAAAAVATLQQLNISIEISTGDSAEAAAAVAGQLGINCWRARQTPEDKLARAQALQRAGHVVSMLGDGINDAPVLAGASVSFAFADGAALTHRAADLVLTGNALAGVAHSIAVARRTRRIVRQNLVWAATYNVVALPFAALGWVAPWLAALGMAGSSLFVVLNALRLSRSHT